VSFKPQSKGNHTISVSFNGQDIIGSPFDLHVHCASADASYLEVKDLGPFPMINTKVEMKITAVDQNGTTFKQGGDNFTATVTINGQSQVGFSSSHFFGSTNILSLSLSLFFLLFVLFFFFQAEPSITDQQNGTYLVSFTPTVSGKCGFSQV
jgi:hypothetical protein